MSSNKTVILVQALRDHSPDWSPFNLPFTQPDWEVLGCVVCHFGTLPFKFRRDVIFRFQIIRFGWE